MLSSGMTPLQTNNRTITVLCILPIIHRNCDLRFQRISNLSYLGGGCIGFRIDGFALKNARIVDFCGKSSGLADFENTVDRGSAVIFDADSGLCRCSVWIFGPKQNLDHRSFFSLSWNVNEFIQIISFFERSSYQLGCETVIEIVLCYSLKECCLLHYLGEINSGIHLYQVTFETLHFCFRMWL